MNTESVRISNDIDSYHAQFDKMFEDMNCKKQLALQSHEDSNTHLSVEESDVLSGFGFNSVQNMVEFKNNRYELEEVGKKITTVETLKKITEVYGKKIISYNQLCDLCSKYNLFFGDATLFKGRIPKASLIELQEFPAGDFSARYNVLKTVEKRSIVGGEKSNSCRAMIVAPLDMFNLNGILLTEYREIIKFPGIKNKCKGSSVDDPIVLIPFKINAINEIFFLIITKWDNSNTL